MPIYDYNGTTSNEIGKLYDYNGTDSTQIGKVYDNNGTTDSLIYTASVTLTNLVGTSTYVENSYSWADIGTATVNTNVKTVSITNGHRYFLRARLVGYAYGDISPDYINGTANFCGTTIVTSGNKSSQFTSTTYGPTNKIIASNATSADLNLYVHRGNSTQGGFTARYYMCVDITALEDAVGSQLTAAQVWTYFGESSWYGTKEIEV